jgi:AcrR family transcriptional regulator
MHANALQADPPARRPLGRPSSRARILAEARLMLREGSYLAFTMESLAQASGVSRQTLYNQFADRDALYRHSRRALLDAFVDDLPRQSDPAVPVESFIARALSVLGRPEHVELSRSADVDGTACPWIALLYRTHVERPLVAAAVGHVGPAWAEAERAALDLVAMLRAAVRGPEGAPLFSASELAQLFLRRLEAAAVAAPIERAVA